MLAWFANVSPVSMHLHKSVFGCVHATLRKQPNKKCVNERMWEDRRGVRRSVYGGDASLVFSQIHHKNQREQRRGKERRVSGLFFSSEPSLRKEVMTGRNTVTEWMREKLTWIAVYHKTRNRFIDYMHCLCNKLIPSWYLCSFVTMVHNDALCITDSPSLKSMTLYWTQKWQNRTAH